MSWSSISSTLTAGAGAGDGGLNCVELVDMAIQSEESAMQDA
jgi:hypothetical protein